MAGWTGAELTAIGDADEVQIESLRRDDMLTKPVTIWVVRLEDDLYVRCMNGPDGAWYRATRSRGQGRIHTAGVGRDVAFADADPALGDRIDGAYRDKYARYGPQYVDPVTSPQARQATIRLLPR
ncbi:DUF2255 family protein [Acrocarpospora catenulata]|uniref:DUF2255 family protein n=1 Tax=Acrocarpospora catenulata TaxID=2836182 RepID=UPI001BDB31AA|nr:DUF2255 family protein [Acrocarpospora catenulata]